MWTLTLLSACSAELGVLSLLGFPASLGASGHGDTLIQWDPSLLSPQRHHFAQAIAILNTHGCNIFDHFSRKVMGLCGGLCGGSWGLARQRSRPALEWCSRDRDALP